MFSLLLALLTTTTTGCGFLVGDSEVLNAPQTMGMSACVLGDRHDLFPGFYGGGEGDEVVAEVSCTNPAGHRVALLVACGYPFKGCTVRTR